MINGWKETKHGLDVDNSAQRKRLERFNATMRSSAFIRLHARKAKVDPLPVQSNTELFSKLTTTTEADEKDQTKENIRWIRLLLGAVICKVMPKMRWEMLRIGKKHVFSLTGGITVHRRSLDTTGRWRQSVGTYSIDICCFIGHAIGYRWESNLNFGRKRPASVLGMCLSALRLQQDQLIFFWAANG